MESNPYEQPEKESKTLKKTIIVGLSIFALGILIYSFGSNFQHIERQGDGAIVDFLGKLVIQVGMTLTSISLIYLALYKKKYDVIIRFGCLLVAGVIIAFEMISFL